MTRGPVDLKIVGDRLGIVRKCLEDLRRLPVAGLVEFESDFRNPATAESLLRRAIEAALDTARHLLARGHGFAALEYREVARQSTERGLIEDANVGKRFLAIAGFRNRLTHFYDEVTPGELFGILTTELPDLEQICEELRRAASRLAGS